MDRTAIYDMLLKAGIEDPAVLVLGQRHILGRWDRTSEVTDRGLILRGKTKAIRVIAEGKTWKEAVKQVNERIAHYKNDKPPSKLNGSRTINLPQFSLA